MKSTITSGDRWREEEEFFEARRRYPRLEKIDQKWSEGASPTLLVKWGYVEREGWEKCFWLEYPSPARCHECPHSSVCPSYVDKASFKKLIHIDELVK